MARERIGALNPERTVGRPVRQMSAGRWLTSTRYVVGWPDRGIIKIGSTVNGRQRYVAFLNRGALVIDLAHYAALMDSLHGEVWLQRRVAREYPAAFSDKSEALDLLPNGGGYTECYLVPVSDWDHIVELANERTAVPNGTH